MPLTATLNPQLYVHVAEVVLKVIVQLNADVITFEVPVKLLSENNIKVKKANLIIDGN